MKTVSGFCMALCDVVVALNMDYISELTILTTTYTLMYKGFIQHLIESELNAYITLIDGPGNNHIPYSLSAHPCTAVIEGHC